MALTIIGAGRGEGKTTFVRHFVENAAQSGNSVGGIIALAVFHPHTRLGYDLVNVRTGECRVLARLVDAHQQPTVGQYYFNSDTVCWGHHSILAALNDGCSPIVIDEVGPLELRGGGWATSLAAALDMLHAAQHLLIVIRSQLVDDVKRTFPGTAWNDAQVISPPWPELEQVR